MKVSPVVVEVFQPLAPVKVTVELPSVIVLVFELFEAKLRAVRLKLAVVKVP